MNKKLTRTDQVTFPVESGFYTRLLCLTGTSKGQIFYINEGRITIGRHESADIQIADAKMSRVHAEIIRSKNKCIVTDLGSQNGIIINDLRITQQEVMSGDKIVIGQTVFKYEEKNVEEKKKFDLVAGSVTNDLDASNESEESEEQKGSDATNPKKKSKVLMLVIILVLVFVLFEDSEEVQKKVKVERTVLSNVSDEIKQLSDKNDPIKPEAIEDVETAILRGMREFRERNYFRAAQEFELALLLDTNNAMASVYLSKTKQKLDEEIKTNFRKAQHDIDSLKYRSAIIALCSIMKLLENNTSDERYERAKRDLQNMIDKLGIKNSEISCMAE